jgi:hypothetical protein
MTEDLIKEAYGIKYRLKQVHIPVNDKMQAVPKANFDACYVIDKLTEALKRQQEVLDSQKIKIIELENYITDSFTASRAAQAEIKEGLTYGKQIFRDYAIHHAKKNDPSQAEKVIANTEHAKVMEKALQSLKELEELVESDKLFDDILLSISDHHSGGQNEACDIVAAAIKTIKGEL